MSEFDRMRTRGPEIVSEIIEGEAIIINLESGNYYSLQAAGADVWAAVESGARLETMIDRLSAKYAAERETIRSEVVRLLGELEEEALITLERVADDGRPSESPVPDPGTGEVPFKPPQLRTYTDMQELLLLDPIHEVDASGWPEVVQDDQAS